MVPIPLFGRWFPARCRAGLVLNQFGTFLAHPPILAPLISTVKVQDPRGSNDVRALSIQVDAAPTLRCKSSPPICRIRSRAVLMRTSFRRRTAPRLISWALAAGSDPLPPGLQLATNGINFRHADQQRLFLGHTSGYRGRQRTRTARCQFLSIPHCKFIRMTCPPGQWGRTILITCMSRAARNRRPGR